MRFAKVINRKTKEMVLINLDNVLFIAKHNKGSKIVMLDKRETILVKETPKEVLESAR